MLREPTSTDTSPVTDLTENVLGLTLMSPKWTLKIGTETTTFSTSNGLLNFGNRTITSVSVEVRPRVYLGPWSSNQIAAVCCGTDCYHSRRFQFHFP